MWKRKMDRLVKWNARPLEKHFVTGMLKDLFHRRWKDECLLKWSYPCSKKMCSYYWNLSFLAGGKGPNVFCFFVFLVPELKKTYNNQNALRLLPSEATPTAFQPEQAWKIASCLLLYETRLTVSRKDGRFLFTFRIASSKTGNWQFSGVIADWPFSPPMT